jgi:hypothetical protein
MKRRLAVAMGVYVVSVVLGWGLVGVLIAVRWPP